MNFQRTLLASAVLSALSTLSSISHAQSAPVAGDDAFVVPKIVVTATPFGQSEKDQILAPAKILAGDELRGRRMSGENVNHF